MKPILNEMVSPVEPRSEDGSRDDDATRSAANSTNENVNPSNQFSFNRLFTNLEVLGTLDLPSMMRLLTQQQPQQQPQNVNAQSTSHHAKSKHDEPIRDCNNQLLDEKVHSSPTHQQVTNNDELIHDNKEQIHDDHSNGDQFDLSQKQTANIDTNNVFRHTQLRNLGR